MKNRIIYALCLMALSVVSCTTEPLCSVADGDKKIEVAIGASATIQSRTMVGEDGYTSLWKSGDQLGIWAANKNGSFEMTATPFTLLHFTDTFQRAVFSAFITPLKEEEQYTYYATFPSPQSTSGKMATFNLPSSQNGSNNLGTTDIMVARPITAAALAEGVVTELGLKFVHKMHALRIILPDNTLQGSPIYKIEFSFPTNVVGDVTVDITDPYAEATLTNGSTNLTLSIPSDYKAGDYLYAMIFPTDLTGNISYRVFAGDYISKYKTISLGKNAQQAHLTPMSLSVPALWEATTFTLDTSINNLNEDLDTLTVTDDATGQVVANFLYNPTNKYTFTVEGALDRSKVYTLTFDTPNAIVKSKLTMDGVIANKINTISTPVPYLLYEDFSCITKESESYGNNDYSQSETNQPGVSLDNVMCTVGWNAARYWAPNSGTCIRINCRTQTVKIIMSFSSSHYGRLDTPQLKNLKSGSTVDLKVEFDAGSYKHKSSSVSISNTYINVATHTNASNPIDGIPTGATGITSSYNTTLADFGSTIFTKELNSSYGENDFSKTFPTFDTTIRAATSSTRICFYPTMVCGTSTGNAETHVYIDNIKISIAK